MLSLKTLLNPAPPGQDGPLSFRPSPTPPSPTFSAVTDTSNSALNRSIMPPVRVSKDSGGLAKSKLRGQVNYPPFENNLDELSLREMRKFRVKPLGGIQQNCLHIPYNSGKKDFFEKTGRESFEVFRYEFTLPGQDTEYAVMWDYNVGLVRMTPFFKCCRYGKTIPAKMLGLNQGLKEITHSITGGSIAAQGYWMPYQCARAVCATFCYEIAGALIPIFGPSFPSDCVPRDSQGFGRMVIDSQIVVEAAREANIARRMHLNAAAPVFGAATSFPRDNNAHQTMYAPEERKHRFPSRIVCNPPWVPENDTDHHFMSAPNSASSTGSGPLTYMVASHPNSSWAPINRSSPQTDYASPHPWLSAVPRIPPLLHRSNLSTSSWGSKRRLEHEDWDYNYSYRDSASPNLSMCSVVPASTPEGSPAMQREDKVELQPRTDNSQQDAAMLLLNLCKRDQESPAMGSLRPVHRDSVLRDEHRSKRQRATSL
ncbi:HTH APSES-type domain-containing protein [Fusarium sp. Ph1]|nr:HTH APSES-type domain-containing protein [Fusarium sp. Ph1]